MDEWICFFIGWGCFVFTVYLHLCFDCLYYYSKWPNKLRKICKALMEE